MGNEHDVQELFAWIAKDPTGRHGIMTLHSEVGAMPVITSKRDIVELLRPSMQEIADQIGVPIELRSFRFVGVLDTVKPK